MKFSLLLIVFSCVVYFGYQIKEKLKSKKIFYEELIAFCEDYKREIGFLKCELKSIVDRCTKNDGLINEVLIGFIENKECKIDFLKEEEVAEIKSFLLSLGKQDIDGEINNVDFYEGKFKTKLGEHVQRFDKFGGFSIKMSALLGLLICVILI